MWSLVLLALLGAGQGGNALKSISIPDSLGIKEIGSWPFGPSYALAEDSLRDLIFLGSGAGVLILQPSDSAGFDVLTDEIRTNGGAIHVLIYDYALQKLYTGGDNAELEVWDVSDPENPTRVATHQDTVSWDYQSATVVDMKLYNSYLIVAFNDDVSSPAYIKIYDTNNLTSLNPVSTIPFNTLINNFWIDNGKLYVQITSYVEIYDLSNISNPAFITELVDGGNFVVVQDTILFSIDVGMWGGDITAYSIANLDTLREIGSANSYMTYLHKVKKVGNVLYLCGPWLETWNVSDPQNIQWMWTFVAPHAPVYDHSMESGTHLTASRDAGLSVIAFDSTGTPFEYASFRVPGFTTGLLNGGGYIYHLSHVLGGNTFLTVLDHDGNYVGSTIIEGHGNIPRAQYLDGHVYIADDSSFTKVDVTNPDNPQVVSSIYIPYFMFRNNLEVFPIKDSFAYVSGDSGIYVISTSSMQIVGSLSDSSLMYGAKHMVISGNYLYMAFSNKLAVIDISNPTSPHIVSVTPFNNAYSLFTSIAIKNNYAYLQTGVNQMLIVDISNPQNPTQANEFFAPNDRGYGLLNLIVQGNYLFGTSESNYSTVVIFDISDPANPNLVAYYDNYYSENSRFVVENNKIYFGHWTIGVHILQFTPTGISEFPISSDGFTVRVTPNILRFNLKNSGYLSLNIYDVSGKRMMHREGIFSRGEHSIGLHSLRNGIYYYTIKSSDTRMSGKIIVVK